MPAPRKTNNPFLTHLPQLATPSAPPVYCDLRTHSPTTQGCPPLRIGQLAGEQVAGEVWEEDWWSDKESDPGSDATETGQSRRDQQAQPTLMA